MALTAWLPPERNPMRRGGKICLTDHFKPLWARNVGKFGIAHAMALGVRARRWLSAVYRAARQYQHPPMPTQPPCAQLAPWLAVEIPDMIAKGSVVHKEAAAAP